MSSRLGRGLRRFVDTLQRGLFDEAPEARPAGVPGDADPSAATPIPGGRTGADPRSSSSHAPREIVLGGERVAYRLVRVRRRSIGFVVDDHGLTVRAPKWVALRDIDDAVRSKQRWILARLLAQRERSAGLAAARIVWRDGAQVAYLGRPLTIVISAHGDLGGVETCFMLATPPASATPSLPCAEDRAEAGASPTHASDVAPRLLVALPREAGEDRIRDAVQSWLQREAARVFAERAAHFEALLGVRVRRLSLSSATTRWGSANANGSVRLHWRLIQHPLATIDYVVAHELSHLREMNHSARFWKVVRSVVPDVEAARSALRDAARSERL